MASTTNLGGSNGNITDFTGTVGPYNLSTYPMIIKTEVHGACIENSCFWAFLVADEGKEIPESTGRVLDTAVSFLTEQCSLCDGCRS